MLWEIAEYFRKKIKLTVIPALRNLFSSWRSLAGLFAVMLILQLLISVVCICGIENIKNQQTVLKEFNVEVSADDGILSESSATMLSTALSSTSIFIGAVIIWGLCALTAYQKITFASADRDKYIWGMYVTHGAKIKKIRGMLKCELYLPHLIATAVGYPLAILICNTVFRDLGYTYDHSVITLLVILALSYLCIRLVVEYECFVIKSMTCTEMLREEDSPKSVCYPRKHSRLVRGFTPLRYATATFIRMRKYYVSLALIAAVPAVIWICFHVSATGEDAFLSSTIKEFSVKLTDGITEEQLNKLAENELGNMDGVDSVSAAAYYEADKIHTHILTDKSKLSTTVDSPYYTDIYADGSLVLAQADTAFEGNTGFSVSKIKKGTVTVISPKEDTEYNLGKGDCIYLAVSKLNGEIRAVNSETLANDLKDEFDYVELEVTSALSVRSESLSEYGFINMDNTYFLLHADDYKKITGRTAELAQYIDSIDTDTTVSENGSFNVRVPLSAITNMPSEGDILEIKGNFKTRLSLEGITDADEEPTFYGKTVEQTFKTAYINSVTVFDGTVTLNVTPQITVVIEQGWGPQPSVVLAFGTPIMESKENSYFANTCGDRLTLTDSELTVYDNSAGIHISSAISASEVGTHAILTAAMLPDTDGRLLLEELYADDAFTLACGDGYTKGELELDLDTPSEGEAILVLPSSAYHYLNFSIGDKLRLAVTLEDVTEYDPNAISPEGNYDTLKSFVKTNRYEYVVCHITDIIYSDAVDEPTVLIGTQDFCKVINKSAPYVSFDIIISSGLESDGYSTLRQQINRWATGKDYPLTVTSTGGYLEYLLRRNANYGGILTLIGSIVPLIVPFIWYYPLASLFDRRRSEIAMLKAMGKRRGTVNGCFIAEGLMVGIGAFAAVLLLCYPTMFIFKAICTVCKLPLTFGYSYLSLPVLMTVGAFSAVCAFISFIICYATTSHRKRGRIRRRHGNT